MTEEQRWAIFIEEYIAHQYSHLPIGPQKAQEYRLLEKLRLKHLYKPLSQDH